MTSIISIEAHVNSVHESTREKMLTSAKPTLHVRLAVSSVSHKQSFAADCNHSHRGYGGRRAPIHFLCSLFDLVAAYGDVSVLVKNKYNFKFATL